MKAPQSYIIRTLSILLFEKNTGGCLGHNPVFVNVQVLLTVQKAATVHLSSHCCETDSKKGEPYIV